MAEWPISERLKDYLEVQYDLHKVLGEGGMGVVILATDRALDRKVAIKVLQKHAAAHPEMGERFRREARVVARLSHPNVVPLHTFGDVDGELFFVMGFVEGETLAARLARDGRIPAPDAIRILREICDALSLAHTNSVVHRDVKPENVLLETRSGRALLADFGIAHESTQTSPLTGTGMAIGTPHYMSPEQATANASVDHRADIYAIGVLAYRMLSGRLPFDGANAREIIAQQMVAKPHDFTRDHPDIPADVVAAVLRCLAKEPADRWPTVATFRDAIEPRRDDDADENLPEALAASDGAFTTFLTASAVGTWFWALNAFWWNNELVGSLAPIASLAPIGGGALVTALLAVRCGLRKTLSVVLRPPRSWILWWPRFARRSGDVWDRLPRILRVARSLLMAPLLLGGPIAIGSFVLTTTLEPNRLAIVEAHPVYRLVVATTMYGVAGGILAAALLSHLWWRRFGREAPAGRKPWLAEPVASPRWKRPDIARYLNHAPSERTAIPETAERLGAAIHSEVGALVRAGVIPSNDPALVAKEVVHAIAAIDKELALLERGGDAADLQRLNERIDAAGTGGLPPDMLDMLVRQREGVRKIIQRQDDQRQRRERLATQLRVLFLALGQVRDSERATTSESVTGRLAVVCSDLRRLASGYDELRDSETVSDSTPTVPIPAPLK